MCSAPAWADLDHWRHLLARAGKSREARIGVATDWCRAAGGQPADDGVWRLPPDLKDGYPLRELKRLARELGLMPKVMFPDSWDDGPQILSRECAAVGPPADRKPRF